MDRNWSFRVWGCGIVRVCCWKDAGAILGELATADLRTQQRVAFYAFGAGLALLLDLENGGWKGRYLKEKFLLERSAVDVSAMPDFDDQDDERLVLDRVENTVVALSNSMEVVTRQLF